MKTLMNHWGHTETLVGLVSQPHVGFVKPARRFYWLIIRLVRGTPARIARRVSSSSRREESPRGNRVKTHSPLQIPFVRGVRSLREVTERGNSCGPFPPRSRRDQVSRSNRTRTGPGHREPKRSDASALVRGARSLPK